MKINQDEANTIHLKLIHSLKQFNPLNVHHVPVFITDISHIMDTSWEMTVQEICKYIDGVNCIYMIAQRSKMDIALTMKAIEHLRFYQVIALIDLFQFSNRYKITAKGFEDLSTLIEPWFNYSLVNLKTEKKLNMQEVAKLFLKMSSSFTGNTTVFKFLEIFPSIFHYGHSDSPFTLDIRKWIRFALIHGRISRLHEYPICLDSNETEDPLLDKLNGEVCMDLACLWMGWTREEMLAFLSRRDNIVTLIK